MCKEEKGCSCGCHHHESEEKSFFRKYGMLLFSFCLLAGGLCADYFQYTLFDVSGVRLSWYLLAYLPVGWPVAREMWESFSEKSYFNEFALMTVASIGAFLIGEYPEGVAVMLFYTIGEHFQDNAVNQARHHITQLLDGRPAVTTRLEGQERQLIAPQEARVGDVLELKAGEKVALDGSLLDEVVNCDTAALTGESLPRTVRRGESLLAGMIVLDRTIRMEVTKPYDESTLAGIIRLVEHANERKAPAERMIRRLARVYTPMVAGLAALIFLLPLLYSWVNPAFAFHSGDWLYRSLVFLVISCPCALVISIPLGYFGGIGAASRLGVLFKGGNYMDLLGKVNVFVFDKTGTLTKGHFEVTQVLPADGCTPSELLRWAATLEQYSLHPIARAIMEKAAQEAITPLAAGDMCEVAGKGMRAEVEGHTLLVGNRRLLEEEGIVCPVNGLPDTSTTVLCAYDGSYLGTLLLEDSLKPDSQSTVETLLKMGYRVEMLSGDRREIVAAYARELGLEHAQGDLLPQDKVAYIDRLRKVPGQVVAFIGDGINDAPVLTMSHVGIAMGGQGSDAAIEAADVVIRNDAPSRLLTALSVSRVTRTIVWQNIISALGIKIVILLLGALGLANLWGAVFADVGVALLAILNAMRIPLKIH